MTKSSTNVIALLQQRGATYGNFADNAAVSQNIKKVIRIEAAKNPRLTSVHQEALEMFAQKMCRILNGDPNHRDNWDDIAGYAKLASDSCSSPKETKMPKPSAMPPMPYGKPKKKKK